MVVVDQLYYVSNGQAAMTEMPTLKQAQTVASTKNMEQVENAVHDDTHQVICSVNGTEYVNTHYECIRANKVCSQQVKYPPTHEKHHVSITWTFAKVLY